MGECMEFPATPAEFIEQYSFKDKEEVYTNGSELIPVFRVNQMLDRYLSGYIGEVDRLRKERDFFLARATEMETLHASAVDRVNKVSFAKLKVVSQLELLQSMVGSVLAHFQVDTEEDEA